MNLKDNLLGLYRKNGYRYAPVALNMCPSLMEKFKAAASGKTFEEYFDYPEGFQEGGVSGLKFLPQTVDWRKYYPEPLKEGTNFSAFGVGHEPGDKATFHMFRMKHPMANFDSLEQMQAYPFPKFDFESFKDIEESVQKIHKSGKAAIGGMACTVWESSWYIRDMTMLMTDMAMESPMAGFILDKITDYACTNASALARAGVDIIALGDDIGMQKTIMMSLDMYRTWLKPRLAKVISAAKKEKSDLLFFYHSCGYVEPFIEDLIEIGIDILNPVQPECMDFKDIHAKYGDRLSFNGTLGTQTTMPFGTADEVRKTVFRNLEIAGSSGGLFCTPTHLLEPEVPLENIEAYVKACKDFSMSK